MISCRCSCTALIEFVCLACCLLLFFVPVFLVSELTERVRRAEAVAERTSGLLLLAVQAQYQTSAVDARAVQRMKTLDRLGRIQFAPISHFLNLLHRKL